jgi:glucose/arabinose dehydrogenase
MPSSRPLPLAVALAWMAFCSPVQAQQGDGTDVPIKTHVFKPAKVAPSDMALAHLKVPPGFQVTTFASGLKNPRILAVAPDGTVYVSRRDQGDVLMLKDADKNG